MSTLTSSATLNQKALILKFMRDFGSITPVEAIEEFGCYRLGARIWDLRHDGHAIKTHTVTRKNRYGKTVSFAKYILEE